MNAIESGSQRSVEIAAGKVLLRGDLAVPPGATGLVLFAHGSGSSRFSGRNRWVARELNDAGLATLLFDLLTEQEELVDRASRALRFDIGLLTRRLSQATRWVLQQPDLGQLPLGYFGSSTGAAAALAASVDWPEVLAVVSRGGRPDLAGSRLERVRAATLLIVGGNDYTVMELNRETLAALRCEAQLEVVPSATHLFEEPGTLEQAATLAADWLAAHLTTAVPARQPTHALSERRAS